LALAWPTAASLKSAEIETALAVVPLEVEVAAAPEVVAHTIANGTHWRLALLAIPVQGLELLKARQAVVATTPKAVVVVVVVVVAARALLQAMLNHVQEEAAEPEAVVCPAKRACQKCVMAVHCNTVVLPWSD